MADSIGGFDAPEYKMKICVDLEKYPGAKAEVDDSVRFEGSGRVCSVTHNDWSYTMEIEVTNFSVPTSTKDSVGPMNEADMALGKMKQKSRY